MEDQALNTTQNAANTYKLLTSAYPQVKTLAVVTSDYHVACAGVLLQIWSDYQSQVNGEAALNVAAGVSCATDTPLGDRMLSSQVWGIAQITGTAWPVVSDTGTETQASTEAQAQAEEPPKPRTSPSAAFSVGYKTKKGLPRQSLLVCPKARKIRSACPKARKIGCHCEPVPQHWCGPLRGFPPGIPTGHNPLSKPSPPGKVARASPASARRMRAKMLWRLEGLRKNV